MSFTLASRYYLRCADPILATVQDVRLLRRGRLVLGLRLHLPQGHGPQLCAAEQQRQGCGDGLREFGCFALTPSPSWVEIEKGLADPRALFPLPPHFLQAFMIGFMICHTLGESLQLCSFIEQRVQANLFSCAGYGALSSGSFSPLSRAHLSPALAALPRWFKLRLTYLRFYRRLYHLRRIGRRPSSARRARPPAVRAYSQDLPQGHHQRLKKTSTHSTTIHHLTSPSR